VSSIKYLGSSLTIDNVEIQCTHEVLNAFETNGVIVVFLDPDADMGKESQYRNLVAYKLSGEKLWEAELPTEKKSDVYWKLLSEKPLKVYSFSSYECEIDSATGKVLTSNFYK
jgi:hypothetical protein